MRFSFVLPTFQPEYAKVLQRSIVYIHIHMDVYLKGIKIGTAAGWSALFASVIATNQRKPKLCFILRIVNSLSYECVCLCVSVCVHS